MAWVRIHDGAMTHPKIVGLTDKAFRLWIWGLSYSQQHLTDGLIPVMAIPARVSKATADLVEMRLWERASGANFQVHDYLEWNDSRELVTKKRTDAKNRMAAARERSTQSVRANNSRTSHEVLRRVGLEKELLEENVVGNLIVSDALGERAGRFVERFEALYSEKRKGAKYLRRQPALDWDRATKLCQTWDDARLEKMAVIFLTTDDDWISGTDRGFAVFCAKATWCDERLAIWESQQKRSAS